MDISSTATWFGGYLLMHDIEFIEGIRSKTVTVDNLKLTKLASVTPLTAQIAQEHILRCNNPLGADSDQNVFAESGIVTVPTLIADPDACWSDVHGNFYASGDEIELAEWESIVLFKFDVPNSSLAFVSGVYTVTGTETITTNQNITGSIVVPDGTTLIIDGAHIGFAESTPTSNSNVVVQPGGTLVVRNGAVLTSWQGCDAPVMWNGIKVLSNGTTPGIAIFESGAKVTNALTAVRCAEGQPGTIFGGDDMAGGTVQATNAIFENNNYDVVTRPHPSDPTAWGPSSFTNCTFRKTRALNNPYLAPGARVSLMGSASTAFFGCTFSNTTGNHAGMGIHAIDTRIRVQGGDEPEQRSKFQGFGHGILHSAYIPITTATIDACDFTDNTRGLMMWGTNNSRVTRCTFAVADVPTGELTVEGAYGAYIYGCSGFEFEENAFTAMGTTHPKVGAAFRNTGIEDNFFYNNTFNGFADASERSVGTVIMGTNASTDGIGLRIKCNDYSNEGTNNYDVAFTGESVAIAGQQGAGDDVSSPAGNTFANVDQLTCDGNDAQHFEVEDAINAFEYWHHQPQASVELVPHCTTAPNTNSNSTWQYTKSQSCPVDLSDLIQIEDDEETAGNADDEHEVLVEVYSNWKDGGDTQGLVDFIEDPGNSSYAVRNQLMLIAPKVSKEAWAACFARVPALNPWHFAQALLANSPLEKDVVNMLNLSDIDPFYKELVENGQNGGTSMHTIYQSEIAHFYGQKATALQAMVRKSIQSGTAADRTLTLTALTDHATVTGDVGKLAMHLAGGTLTQARVLVDAHTTGGEDKHYWDVQDLWLSLLEEDKSPLELDGNGIAQLQGIANLDGSGAAQVQAWLALLGYASTELVLLPSKAKRLKVEEHTARTPQAAPMLSAYPNPSSGPVYLVYQVPEGVEQAEVMIHTAEGKLVRTQRVTPKDGILEVMPKELATGMHVASLYYDGILVGTAKLNVVN